MGCGRGYLTFSLHSFLMKKYGVNSGIKIESVGIDIRPKLVHEIDKSLNPYVLSRERLNDLYHKHQCDHHYHHQLR